VDGSLVLEGNDPKHTATKFVDASPETKAVTLLRLAVQGILDDPNAPFLLDVRSLAQNLVLEILSKPVPFYYILFINSPAMFPGLTLRLSGGRKPEAEGHPPAGAG